MSEPEKIRITLEDLEAVEVAPAPAPMAAPAAPGGARDWGSIADALPEIPVASGQPSVWLKAWFYLGVAGLASAFLAWAVCEPTFEDRGRSTFPGTAMFQIMTVLISVALGTAESIVERSPRKAALRTLLSLIAGTILGTLFYFLGSFVYTMLVRILLDFGLIDKHHPALWCARALAWAAFGVSGGLVYGLVDQSGRKCLYGVLGGMLGAGLGGLLFDPIFMVTDQAFLSRAIGMSIFGLSTGLAIGLVESALKDRWLYVSAGPLTGKQFILYKPVTRIGSRQGNDLYLFKDPEILDAHAAIQLHGPQTLLHPAGLVFVGTEQVTSPRALRSGETVRIGKYAFLYQEKAKATG